MPRLAAGCRAILHSFVTNGATVPHRKRLPERDPQRTEILRRHAIALDGGLPVYADPTAV